MKDQIKLRWATPDEAQTIVELLHANPENCFDPGIMKYPTLQIMCAYNGHVIAYLPTHKALILESTAVALDATEDETIQALRDLVKGATLMASGQQIKEMYFIVTDEKLAKVARNHGFEDKHCLRMRLA